MFNGRQLVIATKHHKENVIAPLFDKAFGLNCFPAKDFDTDLLGTFSGEIDRKDDPVTTLRKKCLLAMELSGCDLGIASEGSFGAHPAIPFVQADDEFIIFIDKKNKLELIERELSTDTNFNGEEVKSEKALIDFAHQGRFPSHAIIMQPSVTDISDIVKGIDSWDLLHESFDRFFKKYGQAYVLTDMRALYNPTRMAVIKKAAEKLITKIGSLCPECQKPGFSVTESKRGLPCERCKLPTKSTLSYIYVCTECSFVKEEKFPNHKQFEEPMFCDYCNP